VVFKEQDCDWRIHASFDMNKESIHTKAFKQTINVRINMRTQGLMWSILPQSICQASKMIPH
jgi:hypothetical protein